jgi:hypothetical protein
MAVVRIFGWIVMALAAMALGAELPQSLEAAQWMPVATGEFWFSLAPGGVNLAQAITPRYLHPAVWDPFVISILQFPLWSVIGFFGIASLAIAGPWSHNRTRRWFRR